MDVNRRQKNAVEMSQTFENTRFRLKTRKAVIMKKTLRILSILILTAILALTFASCGASEKSNTETPDAEATSEKSNTETPDTEAKKDIIPEVDENTLGGIMWAAFTQACKDNATPLDIATAISQNEAIQFMPMVMEIEPGLLSGFDNFEVTGFKSGATFAPMISSIAFVSYVFELEEGANIDEFVNTLKSNCNPNWNICVQAEQTVVGSQNNTVFFVMCPLSNEG